MENTINEVIKLTSDTCLLRNEIRDDKTLDVFDRDLYWFLNSRPNEWTSNSQGIAYQLNRTEEEVIKSYNKLKIILHGIGEAF